MNLPAGRLGGRDCAAKCVAKPCSKRTCGGRIKKMPLKQGTERNAVEVKSHFSGVIKKMPLKQGTEMRSDITVVCNFPIKKMPLKQGTEMIICKRLYQRCSAANKKDAPKAGDGNDFSPTIHRLCSQENKKDAPKAGDGNST